MSGRGPGGLARRVAGRARRALGGGGEDAPDRFPIWLDYPVDPQPRYGYGKPPHPELDRIIAAGRDGYRAHLERFAALVDSLAAIPLSDEGGGEPFWANGWYQGLDAVSLYGFLATRPPGTYLEIGSGNSTKFARRAIRDHGLDTRVVSVDPHPRADVDPLCDEVIRRPLEAADLDALVARVGPGDVVLVDGSHRCFMNSDATVVFTELLPRLAPGVLVHVHDIFLPWDYPPGMVDAMYSEQYLLAAWLLAGGGRLRIVLPNFYACITPDLHRIMAPLWDRFLWAGIPTNGTGFWLETA